MSNTYQIHIRGPVRGARQDQAGLGAQVVRARELRVDQEYQLDLGDLQRTPPLDPEGTNTKIDGLR